jgi:DNA-binding NarL/FixJ family response regulator
VAPGPRRPRVLLGALEPMARLGMSRLLMDDGVEIVGEPSSGRPLVGEVTRLAPDAVVLRIDERDLGERVRAAAPETKVILWAGDETEMRIWDPGSASPRHVVTDGPQALLNELAVGGPGRRGE